eukprot:TRINITY_DN78555_c0_g1_i1.p1 TRINITY_DN78555_c0_g1~~TRINITY_DN78555_c0_g1_i1.p1  ORF type:complete len:238 (+),score=30.85 TRINITY_DN78555_c0_g1_i1:57-770(+)
MSFVLFLDVDGVMNSTQADSPTLGIEPRLLQRVVSIGQAVATGSGLCMEVVISSDWRRKASLMDGLTDALSAVGLRVRGAIAEELSKQCGIRRWLAEYGDTLINWVAIDDLDLQGIDALDTYRGGVVEGAPSIFHDHFVKTDDSVGLTEQGALDAIRLLSAPWANKKSQLDFMKCASVSMMQAQQAPRSFIMVCNECGAPLRDNAEARVHMEASAGEHCMFSEVEESSGLHQQRHGT